MPTPSDRELYAITHFGYGVNNVIDSAALEAEQIGNTSTYKVALREAVNFDLGRDGSLVRRDGYTLLQSGRTTSLWSDERLTFGLCVRGGYLYSLSESGTLTQLTSVTTEQVCCTYLNGVVYWSDGVRSGKVLSASQWAYWGLPVPPAPTLTVASGGDLTRGTYRVAVTCVTSSGEESGAIDFAEIDITDGQKLTVTGIPTSGRSDVAAFNLYVSLPYGETLYFSKRIDLGLGSTVVLQDDLKKGVELRTLYLQPPEGCAFVSAQFGRIITAKDDYVTLSEPLNYNLFNYSTNTIPFDSTVTGIEPALDGWYIGTENGVYFLQGTNPLETRAVRLDYAGVVRGTMRRVERKYSKDKGQICVYWLGTNGLFYRGEASGAVVPLAEDRFKAGEMVSGATLTRQTQTGRHLLFSLVPKSTDAERGLTQEVSDLATFELVGRFTTAATTVDGELE